MRAWLKTIWHFRNDIIRIVVATIILLHVFMINVISLGFSEDSLMQVAAMGIVILLLDNNSSRKKDS